MYSSKLHFGTEHREFVRDVTNVLISYTPVSGIFDTIKFGKKWLHKKRMAHRVARYLQRTDRRNFIKARSRRIRASYERWGRRYNTHSDLPPQLIARMRELN